MQQQQFGGYQQQYDPQMQQQMYMQGYQQQQF